MSSFPLVVFISGTGSTLQAVLEAVEEGKLPGVSVEAVVADGEAAGLAHARARGIPIEVVRPGDFASRAAWDQGLADVCGRYAPRLVVLAGFMRLLGAPMLEAFGGRIINTHPALLPSFPGAHGVRDALAYGVKVTGASVIEVDAGVDTGPILAQRAVTVDADDTEATLHDKIKRVERAMLVEVIAARALADPEPTATPATA
ncbi:MAG: phosphoribosylglycinamide formyltransferase [Dermabacter sp.]|nr:phosphoribosylglycinamide formyltransferase [Dermabacter sp.]